MPPERKKLLLTKLYKPRALGAWVSRPRLTQALNEGLSRKLTLVDAPAGYGKTTLLAQWLSAHSLRSAWLSLDEADNDISTFPSYFAQAIRTVYPDSMQMTATLLSAMQLPPVDELTNTLINELDTLPDEIILVLDDYHTIILDHEYTIGEGGHKIAEVSKKWFRIADTYGVEVAPGQNDGLILSITVAIDEMAHLGK